MNLLRRWVFPLLRIMRRGRFTGRRMLLVVVVLMLSGAGGTVRRSGRGYCAGGLGMTGVSSVTGGSIINDWDMATKSEQVRFVEVVYPAAARLYERQDSVHPVFVTAQAALETGWRIGGMGNNLFGITCGTAWRGRTQLVLTTEYFTSAAKKFYAPEEVVSITPVSEGRFKYRVYRLFRVYDSPEECLSDHFALLRKPGYADAWPYRDDPKEFARRISNSEGARYATAPNYAAVMAGVIDTVEKCVKELGL